MNPGDSEQNLWSPKFMKIALQERDLLPWHITVWCTSLFWCHKRWRFWCKSCRGQGRDKARDNSSMEFGKKSRAKGRLFWNHKETKRKSTLLHWWTYVTSKNAEFEPKLQKYKGRVVLRVDIVKLAQFLLNRARLRPRWLLQKKVAVIASLPVCDGQAADAVSAYTQVKLEYAPRSLKIPKSECPDVWIRLPRHKWPKSWANIEDPVVLLERHLCGDPLAWLLWERQFEEALLELGWEKFRIGNVCSFIEKKKGYFCQCMWMTSKRLEKSRIWLPCGRNWWKMWILTNSHHFLTMCA